MTDHTLISKVQWLRLARNFYTHLVAEMRKLDENQWNSSTRYLGWNCRDLVNHMTSAITINFSLLIKLALDGKPVPEPGFNLFLRNANEVARRKKDPSRQILDEFEKEIFALLDRYDSMTDEQWLTPAFFYIGVVDIRTLFLVQFADNVVHERDLLIVNQKWKAFNPDYIDPLLDWFMTVFRPGTFKSAIPVNDTAKVQFSFVGNVTGSWVMTIENNSCSVKQGREANPDIELTMTVEDLIYASLARCSPFVGKVSRAFEWFVEKEKREDFAAKFTGMYSGLSSMLSGKIKVTGDKKKTKRIMQTWFWHFWERTEQTQVNIARANSQAIQPLQ